MDATTSLSYNMRHTEKIVIVPPHDPQDIRPESELFLQPALLRLQFLHHSPLMLPKLPLPLASSFVCCPAIKLSFAEVWEILSWCGKLKGFVSKCPYFSMKGGAQGGTYVIVLDVKLFDELNK